MSHRNGTTRSAFSLVEALVVFTIINILLALLIPAIRAIREEARRVACASNLKQIGTALSAYMATEGQGGMPATKGRPGDFWAGVEGPNYLALYPALFEDAAVVPDPIDRPVGAPVHEIASCPSDGLNDTYHGTSYIYTYGGHLPSRTGEITIDASRRLARMYDRNEIGYYLDGFPGPFTPEPTVIQDYSHIDPNPLVEQRVKPYHGEQTPPFRDNALMWDMSVQFDQRTREGVVQ